MSRHTTTVRWGRRGAAFTDNKYSREHTWSFDGGVEVPASSSPHVVPIPFSNPANVDPEEAFIASLSSCHMLWFLSIAAKRGFTVDSYHDDAVGLMERNGDGRLAITRVELRPHVVFSGEKLPTDEEISAIHDEAHHSCFIASSVKSDVVVMEEGMRDEGGGMSQT